MELNKLEGYEWIDGEGLFRKTTRQSRKVCNSIPHVRKIKRLICIKEQIQEQLIEIVYENDEGKRSVPIQITETQLMKATFTDALPSLVIVQPDFSKKVGDIFKVIIQTQLDGAPVVEEKQYEYGWNDKTFCWGSDLKDVICKNECQAYESTVAIANLICRSDKIALIMLAALHGPLRRILNEARIEHNYVTYVMGPTGIGKTGMVEMLCNYHKERNVFLSLGSERKNLKDYIYQMTDSTVIVDDFSSSASNRVRERQLQVMSEIIQEASDSGRILRHDFKINNASVHLVVTAEKMINNFSTLNRCCLVRIEERNTDETWKALQEFATRGRMKQFMEQFLIYVEKKYDEIQVHMKTDYAYFSESMRKKLYYKVPGIDRIRNTTAIQLTLKTCVVNYMKDLKLDANLIKKVNKQIESGVHDSAVDLCIHLETLMNKERRIYCLEKLAEMISQIGNGYYITYSEEKYYNNILLPTKKGQCIGCCLNDGYISFNPDRICEQLQKLFEENEVITKTMISKELNYYALGRKDSEGKLSNRWNSKKRMYHVKVRELLELNSMEYVYQKKIFQSKYPR